MHYTTIGNNIINLVLLFNNRLLDCWLYINGLLLNLLSSLLGVFERVSHDFPLYANLVYDFVGFSELSDASHNREGLELSFNDLSILIQLGNVHLDASMILGVNNLSSGVTKKKLLKKSWEKEVLCTIFLGCRVQ